MASAISDDSWYVSIQMLSKQYINAEVCDVVSAQGSITIENVHNQWTNHLQNRWAASIKDSVSDFPLSVYQSTSEFIVFSDFKL